MKVEIGTVIRSHVREAGKTKRYVVVAETTDGGYLAFLLINSRLTNYARKNKHIRKMYLELPLKGRETYLEHDSYLFCGEVFAKDKRTLEHMLKQTPERILGAMSDGDLQTALHVVVDSGVYSQVQLENWGVIPR